MTAKVVAELSGSHNRSWENCINLIENAKDLQVDYIKFQVYRAADLATKRCFTFTRVPTRDLLALYTANETPREWWPEIIKQLNGHPWGASVFSEKDLNFIMPFKPHYLKIASYELTDLSLIAACAQTRKPLVISVNHSASKQDVLMALNIATEFRVQPTFLMATRYWGAPPSWDTTRVRPTLAAEIQRFRWLRQTLRPEIDIGLSDHLPPGRSAMASYATGKHAVMVERHLRLENVETSDTPFSSTAEEFQEYIGTIRGWDGKATGTSRH